MVRWNGATSVGRTQHHRANWRKVGSLRAYATAGQSSVEVVAGPALDDRQVVSSGSGAEVATGPDGDLNASRIFTQGSARLRWKVTARVRGGFVGFAPCLASLTDDNDG